MTVWHDKLGVRTDKPFLCELHASDNLNKTVATKRLTVSVRMREAMQSGEWMTVSQICAASGLSADVVNSKLQNQIRNRLAEKEYAIGMRPRGSLQRYRIRAII